MELKRVEVISTFSLNDFDKLQDIVRKNPEKSEAGWLYLGDTFICDEYMAEYLTGHNDKKKTVVKILETIMQPIKEESEEVKPKKKSTKKSKK